MTAPPHRPITFDSIARTLGIWLAAASMIWMAATTQAEVKQHARDIDELRQSVLKITEVVATNERAGQQFRLDVVRELTSMTAEMRALNRAFGVPAPNHQGGR